MESLQLPASLLIPKTEENNYYAVVDQEDDLAYVQHEGLTPGDVLVFDSLIKGTVLQVKDQYAQVKLESSVFVTGASKLKQVDLTVPSYYRLNTSYGLGGISVNVDTSILHKQGYLGWSLETADHTLLAVGNDSIQINNCIMPSEGSWKAGSYVLYIQLFSFDTLMPLKAGTVTWTVNNPLETLEAGNYHDSSPIVSIF